MLLFFLLLGVFLLQLGHVPHSYLALSRQLFSCHKKHDANDFFFGYNLRINPALILSVECSVLKSDALKTRRFVEFFVIRLICFFVV